MRTAHQAGFGTVGVVDASAHSDRAELQQLCTYFYDTLEDFDAPVTAPGTDC